MDKPPGQAGATAQAEIEVGLALLLAQWEDSGELATPAARRILRWLLGHDRFVELVAEYQRGAG